MPFPEWLVTTYDQYCRYSFLGVDRSPLSLAADRRCCQEEVIDPGKRQGGLARVTVRGVEFTIRVGLI